MKDDITDEQIEAIKKALDEAITTGPWEESNFLRVVGKNLREIRDNFVNQLHLNQDELTTQSTQMNRVTLQPGQQEVYIALYSSEGSSLPAWERIINNLPRHLISRPIYADEQAVQYFIKSKENRVNEAYLVVYINQSDILAVPEEKILKDKFGKPLLTLKDRSVSLENIVRFIHLSGTYQFAKGRLTKLNS